ncbi:MAG: YqeG family HAD IIIA-type phosphatase [Bacilli bacterium]|nr:YqeG family HAD IIIA-type phosphatase [Bacilli bacterium]
MFDKFVPDKYFKSIYDINYESLKGSGIKCLIFDLTNTLEPEMVRTPSRKVKDLFEDLKDMGFKLIIMSNRLKNVVTPFKEQLCVDSCYLSFKPFKHKYKTILKLFDYKDNEVACIGDQLFYDILGANKMNLTSILVNPIGDPKFELSRLNRKLESVVINHLTKKDLFKRGRYYE